MQDLRETADKPVVRPARRSDGRAICALVLRGLLDPTVLGCGCRRFWVAESDGRVIGCGQIREYRGVRELSRLVVRREFRGRGIGSALVRALIGQTDGALHLQCRRELTDFYGRFGFRVLPTDEVPWPLRLKLRLGNLFAAPLMRTRFVAMRRG